MFRQASITEADAAGGMKAAGTDSPDLSSVASDVSISSSFSDISVRDLANHLDSKRKTFWRNAWYCLIGSAALLDFLAKVVGDFIRHRREADHENSHSIHRHFDLHFWQHKQPEVMTDADPIFVIFIKLLDKYSIPISVFFSLLWFADAFVVATRKRNLRLQEIDRTNVLQQRSKAEKDTEEINGAWGTYYRAILIQCLLLPVSFIIVAHHVFRPGYSVSEILLDQDEIVQLGLHNDEGKIDSVYSFDTHLSQSVIYVLGQYLGTVFVKLTGLRMRKSIKKLKQRLTKKIAYGLVRNPRQFVRDVRRALRALRWLKYLAPLIATSNKLRGNVMDYLKKRRQRLHAAKAERARRLIWVNQLELLTPEEKETYAASLLQRLWRRRRARKLLRALLLIQGNKEVIAAQKVQHVFRSSLLRARERIRKKREELRELQRRQHEMSQHKEQLSVKERRRLYELQDEIGEKAKEMLNRKMLLRPNTRFAVLWKVVFVVCVVLEISQLALSPMLSKYVDDYSGDQMNIGKILELHLVPTPTTEWKVCGADSVDVGYKIVEKEKNIFIRVLKKMKRKLQKTKPVESETVKDYPWFCRKPFTTLQSFLIYSLRQTIYEFLTIVGIVCFMDVFVTFFTGELDTETGNLIPKPFFERWVFPGIALQLLVNPQMESVSKVMFSMQKYLRYVGPIRVYRWLAAFFYPLVLLIIHFLIHDVWRPLVKRSNENTVLNDPFSKTQQKDPFSNTQHSYRRASMEDIKESHEALKKMNFRSSFYDFDEKDPFSTIHEMNRRVSMKDMKDSQEALKKMILMESLLDLDDSEVL